MIEVRGQPCRGRSARGRGVMWGPAVLLVLMGWVRSAQSEPASTIILGEAVPKGSSSRIRIEMKAHGLFRPALPPGKVAADARMPKPMALDVQTRLVFNERVLGLVEDAMAIDSGKGEEPGAVRRGRPAKVARHVIQAAAAINGEKGELRPMTAVLRQEVSVLVAERRREEGPVVVMSPAGPLTRAELQVVQSVGDPLALAEILPSGPVTVGRSWRVGEAAARGISEYDVITANTLDATLESFDETRAIVRLQGRIEGSLQGAQGLMTCDGVLTFDRRMGWIDRLELNRNESRRPGPIEAGLDVKSTMTMTRAAEPAPATLKDGLSRYSLEITPRSERLLQIAPDGKSFLLHDRRWHVFWDDPKVVVLKRLDGRRVVAQCNLAVGPSAGRGRHQDPAQFRDEIRRVLDRRFVQFIGMGEVEGDPAGGFRFKVGVQGREGDLGVVWYYYLIAGPEGDQLVATYTLAAQDARVFGEQDAEMIGTLRWYQPQQAASGRP
jgi:hypothetical protein